MQTRYIESGEVMSILTRKINLAVKGKPAELCLAEAHDEIENLPRVMIDKKGDA